MKHISRSLCIVTLLFQLVLMTSALAAEKDKPKANGDKQDKAETRDAKVRAITLKVPKSWKQTEPTSRLRAGQFAIPAVDDKGKDAPKGKKEAAELAIYTFSGGGGGVDANIRRWIGQFAAEGRKAKTTTGKSKLGDYVLVDVKGTYNKPIGPPIRGKKKAMSNARMLAVILAVPKKGNYFLKLTGDEKTVTKAAKAFRASFGANKKEEKEYKPEN